jgi:RPA family protein
MPELQKFHRQVAYKVRISDILSGNFIKNDFSGGYIQLNYANVSRVNLIGTVVHKSENPNYVSVVIDDGANRMLSRTFENNVFISKVDVGDIVLLIGKIREFNNEKYVVPEIIKKISVEWMNVRKLELKGKSVINEDIKREDKDLTKKEVDDIYELVKKLDYGDGVAIEEVLKKVNNTKTEHIINKLLEKGDVFEVRPGKLRVLE